MIKRSGFILLILILALMFTGCGRANAPAEEKDTSVSVEDNQENTLDNRVGSVTDAEEPVIDSEPANTSTEDNDSPKYSIYQPYTMYPIYLSQENYISSVNPRVVFVFEQDMDIDSVNEKLQAIHANSGNNKGFVEIEWLDDRSVLVTLPGPGTYDLEISGAKTVSGEVLMRSDPPTTMIVSSNKQLVSWNASTGELSFPQDIPWVNGGRISPDGQWFLGWHVWEEIDINYLIEISSGKSTMVGYSYGSGIWYPDSSQFQLNRKTINLSGEVIKGILVERGESVDGIAIGPKGELAYFKGVYGEEWSLYIESDEGTKVIEDIAYPVVVPYSEILPSLNATWTDTVFTFIDDVDKDGTNRGNVCIIDLETGIKTCDESRNATNVKPSPNGELFAVTMDYTLYVLNSSGEVLLSFSSACSASGWSSDSRYLQVNCGGPIGACGDLEIMSCGGVVDVQTGEFYSISGTAVGWDSQDNAYFLQDKEKKE